ncbi:capsid cement protein [Microbacterium sp. MMO-56]|uniref:capsid cement protein n=1 Tax=Microbacterium sp. MMO-56 TaxID=3081281 RepID=UPI0030164118
MADYLPKFKPGQAVTFTASADVTGGRLVAVTGVRTVGPAGADSAAVAGVAGFDAVAGERVTVFTRAGGVQQLVAAGVIAAGAKVSAAADGKVQTVGSTVNPIGLALEPAAANNDVIDVLFI